MIKRIDRYSFILILISGLLYTACNSNVVFTDSAVMKDNKWKLFDVPVFKVPISDTLNSNNVSFTIRTGSAYPFRNIYLFVTATSPDGKSITDTLQYFLADEKGKWYGKGFGDIHELNLPNKSNVFFPLKGTYEFKIRHGMRLEDLTGVYDIGIRIEKMSNYYSGSGKE
jgi:gliding motility-associated lipoprotein GldH